MNHPTFSSQPLHLVSLLTTLMSVLFSAPALASALALLPIAQEGGTAETAFGIENVLRQEVADTRAGELMARDTIIGHIAGAKSIDIVCKPTNAACLKQLGELAGVDSLVSPEIKSLSGTSSLASSSKIILEISSTYTNSLIADPSPQTTKSPPSCLALYILWIKEGMTWPEAKSNKSFSPKMFPGIIEQ